MADRSALRRLAQALRGSAGSLRAAAEALASHPEPAPDQRRRLIDIVVDEAQKLGRDIERLERLGGEVDALAAHRPARELVDRLAAATTAAGCSCSVSEPVPEVELAPLPQAVLDGTQRFFSALRRQTSVGGCTLSTRGVDRYLLFDLAWEPHPAELTRLLEWQGQALDDGWDDRPGLRAALREADGEIWFNLDRDGTAAHLRLLVPQAKVPEPSAA